MYQPKHADIVLISVLAEIFPLYWKLKYSTGTALVNGENAHLKIIPMQLCLHCKLVSVTPTTSAYLKLLVHHYNP